MERTIDETSRANAAPRTSPAVTVLADDLIWSTWLVSMLRSIAVPARTVARLAAFDRALPAGGSAIVDLTARGYDGIDAVTLAAGRGARILCLVQHDDVPTRRAALAAGATRVVPYRTMHERGPETLRRWLAAAAQPGDAAGDGPGAGSDPAAAAAEPDPAASAPGPDQAPSAPGPDQAPAAASASPGVGAPVAGG